MHTLRGRLQGYYRRADAKLALGKFTQALRDFRLAVKVAPRDPDLKRKLSACEKESQRQRFEKALRSGVRALPCRAACMREAACTPGTSRPAATCRCSRVARQRHGDTGGHPRG